MANLNVLPQVSAKPQSLNSDPATQLKGGEATEVSKEFQANLSKAVDGSAQRVAQNKNQQLLEGLAEASEEGVEKGQLLAAGNSMPLPAVPTKNQALHAEANVNGLGKAQQNPISSSQVSQAQELNTKLEKMMKKADANASSQNLGQKNIPSELLTEKVATSKADVKVKSTVPQSLNGIEISELPQDYAFDLESLEVQEGASSFEGASELKNRVPSSKLSTADYLNLRDLSQKNLQSQAPVTRDVISPQGQALRSQTLQSTGVGLKALSQDQDRNPSSLNEAAPAPLTLNPIQQGVPFKTIDAPVTQGTNQVTILSHDALHQITHQVNHLHQAKQDGEIKIRLRPDHLGELQMSVKTQGNAVSIQIKAQDGQAKKIIEESLSSLRDSLSQQNLTLGRVDVVAQPNQAAAQDSSMQMDLGQFRQNHDQSFAQDREQGARQERLYEDNLKSVNLNTSRNVSASRSRTNEAGGLDLIA